MLQRWWILGIIASFSLVPIYIVHSEAVGIWLLNERTGKATADASGNRNDGKLVGTIRWTAKGKIGAALEGNGEPGWVEIPSSDSLKRAEGPFTVMAWAKINVAGQHGIFTKSTDAPVKHQDWGLYVWDGKIRFAGNWPEGWTAGKFTGKSNIKEDQWLHFAVTWGEKKMIFYLNGKADAKFDWNDNFKDTEASVIIGADPAGGDEPLNGSVDEVAMFDEVLSNENIQKAMNGLEKFLAVDSLGKLATAWAKMKNIYQ